MEDPQKKIDSIVEFNHGLVTCSQYEDTKKFHMSMWCPGGIVQEIIRNDFSWDGVQAGYWAIYDRNPDVYNIALWKLFHAPWQARQNYSYDSDNSPQFPFDRKSAIADIIDDGIFDYFVGDVSGRLAYYTGEGISADGPNFEFVTDFFQNIQIVWTPGRHGANSIIFYDLDSDSDLDLVWGDFYQPGLFYLEN